MVRFKTLADYGDGDVFYIGTKQNNGDFDWFPVIRVTCLDGYSDYSSKWAIDLLAVSPSEAGEANLQKALGSGCGFSSEEDELSESDKVLALAEYGVSCCIQSVQGNNLSKLLKEAKKEAQLAAMLTGFYFDRSVNVIGTDGWSALKGDLYGHLRKEGNSDN